MADTLEKNVAPDERAGGRLAEPEKILAIKIKLGLKEERRFDIPPGRRAGELLEIVAREQGLPVAELILFRDGDDEPITTELVIDADYPCERRHHLHHKGDVEVIVFYQSKDHRRAFRRHATVGHVLIWAIKVFDIDPTMASEFDLALHGSKDALPESEHIGHLAQHHKILELDLIRGDIANGSAGP